MSFAPSGRALPLALFTADISVGAGLVLVLGNISSGVAATRRRGQAGIGPVAVAGPLAPSPLLVKDAVLLIYFALAFSFGVATASFVAVTPAPLRGRMIALYLMLGNLIGLRSRAAEQG